MNCAMAKYAKHRTPNEEKEARERGETRRCRRCGEVLVAIGNERANGNPCQEDWDDRSYHKKCWREMMKEREGQHE
jgi:hypothetical protein